MQNKDLECSNSKDRGGKDAFLKKKVRIHIGVKAFPFDAQLFQVEYEAVNLPQ